MRRARIEPGPGQESVWDYPRPPRAAATTRHVQVIFMDCGMRISEYGLKDSLFSNPHSEIRIPQSVLSAVAAAESEELADAVEEVYVQFAELLALSFFGESADDGV